MYCITKYLCYYAYLEKYKPYLSKFMLSSFSDELRYVRLKNYYFIGKLILM